MHRHPGEKTPVGGYPADMYDVIALCGCIAVCCKTDIIIQGTVSHFKQNNALSVFAGALNYDTMFSKSSVEWTHRDVLKILPFRAGDEQ